jgi:hypothetical protein
LSAMATAAPAVTRSDNSSLARAHTRS